MIENDGSQAGTAGEPLGAIKILLPLTEREIEAQRLLQEAGAANWQAIQERMAAFDRDWERELDTLAFTAQTAAADWQEQPEDAGKLAAACGGAFNLLNACRQIKEKSGEADAPVINARAWAFLGENTPLAAAALAAAREASASQENKPFICGLEIKKLTDEDIILPKEAFLPEEKELTASRERILKTRQGLIRTCYPEDTAFWGHGLVPLEREVGETNEHYWKRQDAAADAISQALKDDGRIGYFDDIWRLQDEICALAQYTPWLSRRSALYEGITFAKAARQNLETVKKGLDRATKDFEAFLGSENFGRAFSLKIDRKTGNFTISDLPLDAEHLKTIWNQLSAD